MREGWALLCACVGTVARDRELAVLPLLAVVPPVAIFLWAFGGVGLMGLGVPGAVAGALVVLGALAGLVAWAFVPLLAQAAIAAGALERFRGGDPTVRSALRTAWARRGPLFRRLGRTPRGTDPHVAHLVADGRLGPEDEREPSLAERELDTLLTVAYLLSVVPGFVLGGGLLKVLMAVAEALDVPSSAYGWFIVPGAFAMVAGILWGIGLVGMVANVAAAARYHRARTGVDPFAASLAPGAPVPAGSGS